MNTIKVLYRDGVGQKTKVFIDKKHYAINQSAGKSNAV